MDWATLPNDIGDKPTTALARARAAQIFAEMLGILCHQEYIDYEKDQTVYPSHPSRVPISNVVCPGHCRAFQWLQCGNLLCHRSMALSRHRPQ